MSGIRVCLALIIALCLLQAISLAKPSAVEIDNANKDLNELEALLTGQHPGSSLAGDVELYKPSRPEPNLTPLMDLPYRATFLNDTIFGSFIRELAAPQINGTDKKGIFNSSIWSSINAETEASIARQKRKPLLISEPDF